MGKQLIERIALEAMRSIAAEDPDTPIEVVDDMSSEDKRIMVEFCTRFLARIDAERGKDAVGMFAVLEDKNWHQVPSSYVGSIPLFLSAPTIPEGMALVPIEPTDAMLDAFFDAGSMNWIQAYAAMITAAQGESNAD